MKALILGLALAISLEGVSVMPVMAAGAVANPQMPKMRRMDQLTDVPANHWAYQHVKVVMEILGVMPPKMPREFNGQDIATRYEVAQILYNAAQHLEITSSQDLKMLKEYPVHFIDLDKEFQNLINRVVSEYGLMSRLPDRTFRGRQPITRYEVATDLNRYLEMIEYALDKNMLLDIPPQKEQIADIPDEYWSHRAVQNIVNKYQIMNCYGDHTFRGKNTLTRYELAAVIRAFMDVVDIYMLPHWPAKTVAPTPKPTPLTIASPTPMPSSPCRGAKFCAPTPAPVPTVAKPAHFVDIKLGGSLNLTGAARDAKDNATTPGVASLYGPHLDVDVWLPKLGTFRLGAGLNGEYLFYEPNRFGVDNLSLYDVGGTINWRLLEGDGPNAPSLVLGLGYGFMGANGLQIGGTQYAYSNHGLRAELGVEIPIVSWLGLFAEDRFTYMLSPDLGYTKNMIWRNDFLLGVHVPVYTWLAVQLGYRDMRYSIQDTGVINGSMGGFANLRLCL